MRIDNFIPDPRLRQTEHRLIAADAATTWAAVRHFDIYDLKFARALFYLRTVPEHLKHLFKGDRPGFPSSSRIDDFTKEPEGFHILAEDPGREIVVGTIGKVWKLDIPFVNVRPEKFAAFNEPDYVKVAWCIRVDPREKGQGSWFTFDLRVTATDEAAWKKFGRYWLLIGNFSHLIRRALISSMVKKLGALDEDKLGLAGDKIIRKPKFQKTLAKTIEEPAEKIWPWLVQMGGRRAGWYSIDFFDNAKKRSAERIIPDLQKIQVGDVLPALPDSKAGEGFAVLEFKRNKYLVLGSPSLLPGNEAHKKQEPPFTDTWSFTLEPIGDFATRLITRVRGDYNPEMKMSMLTLWLGTAHEIMQRAQLRNLKMRAEGAT